MNGLNGTENYVSELERSYLTDSLVILDDYLKRWSDEITPINEHYYAALDDTSKFAYEVFDAFYCPKNLKKISTLRGIDSANAHNKYYFVQNSLKVTMCDSIQITEHKILGTRVQIFPVHRKNVKVIRDFAPLISDNQVPLVYLTEERSDTLITFLNSHHQLDTKERFDMQEMQKRWQFLNKYVSIEHGFFIGSWGLHTPPFVYNIDVTPDFDLAAVTFKVKYEAGTAIFEKSEEGWEFIATVSHGVE